VKLNKLQTAIMVIWFVFTKLYCGWSVRNNIIDLTESDEIFKELGTPLYGHLVIRAALFWPE